MNRAGVVAALRGVLARSIEPHFLFPGIAIVLLGLIWGGTWHIGKVGLAAAERAVAVAAQQQGETYEAQVVRALHEIDQTLKSLKYACEIGDMRVALQDLKARALLPPERVFAISIVDAAGDVVASTGVPGISNIADRDYFRIQVPSDHFSVAQPQRTPGSEVWTLHFSRRLDAPGGRFAGVVVVSVAADYFVSGYEPTKLGERGVLGMLGNDGVFRVRRSGDAVVAGDGVDYAALVPSREGGSEATLSSNPWDGVRRYTHVRQLYGFPLAVVVGLSADEQLRDDHAKLRNLVWLASAGSLFLLLVLAALDRLRRELDLSRRRAMEEQVEHAARVEYLAYHDGLTTLPNGRLFSNLLGQSIKLAHRQKRQLAVLFLDLDAFKPVNDTLGHEAGDQLLQEVAVRLRAALRESDIVARLGGDEFVALLPAMEDEKYVATVARKILDAIARPFALRGRELRVTASVGISVYPQDGLDEQALKKNADIAMYHAKDEGKNNFRFFSGKPRPVPAEEITPLPGTQATPANEGYSDDTTLRPASTRLRSI